MQLHAAQVQRSRLADTEALRCRDLSTSRRRDANAGHSGCHRQVSHPAATRGVHFGGALRRGAGRVAPALQYLDYDSLYHVIAHGHEVATRCPLLANASRQAAGHGCGAHCALPRPGFFGHCPHLQILRPPCRLAHFSATAASHGSRWCQKLRRCDSLCLSVGAALACCCVSSERGLRIR